MHLARGLLQANWPLPESIAPERLGSEQGLGVKVHALVLCLALASANAWAQTPPVRVPFAGYGDARVRLDCTSVPRKDGWSSECDISGDIQGDDFTLPLDHAFRLGSAGCALVLPDATAADIACRRLGNQFGSWIEVREILGTPCRAVGTVWSRVAAESDHDPLFHVVVVDVELLIGPGQALCEAGIWNETRYYLVCVERPDPSLSVASVNERVCGAGVEFLTFEAVHRKQDGRDQWFRRLFAQVRSVERSLSGRR